MRGRAVAVAGPGSSLAITGLGRIVIGRRQLTAGGLLREPTQFGDARRDKYLPRERSHGVPVRRFWRWSGHSARLSHGPPRQHCNAYEFARLDFLRRRLSLLQSLSFSAKLLANRLLLPGLSWMAGAGDPVATSLVESLARPGGNFIGASSGGAEVAGKRLPPQTLTR
jgi:hypothetical protein